MRKVFPSLHDVKVHFHFIVSTKIRTNRDFSNDAWQIRFLPHSLCSKKLLESFSLRALLWKQLSHFLFFNSDTKYLKMFTVICLRSLHHDYVGLGGNIN